MENKNQNFRNDEGASQETENAKKLNELWKNEIILSKKQVQQMLKAFEREELNKESDCLIFKDKLFSKYRVVGEQHEFALLPSGNKYPSSHEEEDN